MASNDRDIYVRLGTLEQLVRHLYERTGVPIPDLQALAGTEVSDHVRQLVASGNKIGAIKAYRANVDLPTATRLIESHSGGSLEGTAVRLPRRFRTRPVMLDVGLVEVGVLRG